MLPCGTFRSGHVASLATILGAGDAGVSSRERQQKPPRPLRSLGRQTPERERGCKHWVQSEGTVLKAQGHLWSGRDRLLPP